jgi:hypothetical protein
MQPIDARSARKDFDKQMREQGLIRSYAKDHDYKLHGFDFIKTEDDVDKFLVELDSAPTWHSMGNGSCTKALRIRSALSKPDEFNWGKVNNFKMYASFVRRTCCGCHETGSFKPNKT